MPRPREFDDGTALDAAMETFWTKGYEATTTAELCENTGLGRGSLYNAFGSKHAPVAELTRRHFERLEQALREVIEEGQRAGEFAPDRDPAQLARTLQSTYYGLRILGSVAQDRTTLLDVAEGALTALH